MAVLGWFWWLENALRLDYRRFDWSGEGWDMVGDCGGLGIERSGRRWVVLVVGVVQFGPVIFVAGQVKLLGSLHILVKRGRFY